MPELRQEPRLCTLFRVGKLLSGSAETICRVRNISQHGFMADACPAPAVGTAAALELSEGWSREARVVWSQGDRFGAEFLAPQSVSAMLGGGVRSPHQRQRALRVAPDGAFATVVHGNRAARASIVNISQTGAAVFAYDLLLSAVTGRDLSLEIDGLEPMAGTLCWTADGAAGIQFERPLSFETLSHWLWATSLARPAARPLH
ncbi:MAG TPA: PilZ domain-containing protein [Allosphingosinicella sp.]